MKALVFKAVLPIIVFGSILCCTFWGCSDTSGPVSNRDVIAGEVIYESNSIKAPGAELISEGNTFSEEAKISENRLVGIKYKDKVYIFYTGMKNEIYKLDENTSKKAIANFIGQKYLDNSVTQSLKNSSIQGYQWELSTGIGINKKTPNEYDFSNFKYRWAAVDNSIEIKYLTPKTFIKWSFVDWDNALGFDLADTKTIVYKGNQFKTYGSVISALASLGNGLLIDQDNLQKAYNENPDLVMRLNAAEFFDIMVSGIEQIVGLLPDSGCLDATLFNFIYNTLRTIGFDLLIGKESAKEAMASQTEDFFNEIGACVVSAAGTAVGGPMVEEFIKVLSSLSWLGQMSIGSWDAATSKYYEPFTPQENGNIILTENFENGFDSRIVIFRNGNYTKDPAISYISNFGSYVFGFGKSDCYADCYNRNGNFYEQPYSTTIRITFSKPTYISSISFREAELDGNWGSVGYLLVDGENITGDQPYGINPNSTGEADASVRFRLYSINKSVNVVEFGVWDITNASEIFIDDIVIRGN